MPEEPQGVAPEPMRRSEADSPAPGSVRTQVRVRPELAGHTTEDLIVELLTRTRCGQELRSRDERFLGELQAQLDVRLHTSAENRFSLEKSLEALRGPIGHPDFELAWLEGKDCLEVGAGGASPLAPHFLRLLAGARTSISVDMEDMSMPDAATRACFHCIAPVLTGQTAPGFPFTYETLIGRVAGFDFGKVAAGELDGIPADRMRHIAATFEGARLETRSVDLVMSIAFLEHVEDPSATIAEMARVSRPGALGIHGIDGRDHRAYSDPSIAPLDFLRVESDAAIVYGCNRMRPLDYGKLFEEHGFEVRKLALTDTIEVAEDVREEFVEPFRSMDRQHLGAVGALYYVRKK